MDFYTRILNEKQKLLLPKLGSILSEAGFYLAGGTALALQLGHRTSLDFDFYSPNPFDRKTLSGKLNRAFGKGMVTCESHSEETLFAEIGGVKFSAFFYPYALVDSLKEYEGVKIASVEDIAAMKVAAIVQRGKQRDFVDLYFLIQKLGIGRIIEAAYQKYPWYKDMGGVIIKPLTYFVDADSDKEVGRIEILNSRFSWKEAKEKIAQEVEKFSQEYLGGLV